MLKVSVVEDDWWRNVHRVSKLVSLSGPVFLPEKRQLNA